MSERPLSRKSPAIRWQATSWKARAAAANCGFQAAARVSGAAIALFITTPGKDVPVLLLALIDKGESENLSKAERNALRKELAGYADDYRKAVARKVAELKR